MFSFVRLTIWFEGGLTYSGFYRSRAVAIAAHCKIENARIAPPSTYVIIEPQVAIPKVFCAALNASQRFDNTIS